MPKHDIGAALKKRAAHSAEVDEQVVNEVYETIFGTKTQPVISTVKILPLKKCRHFFTARIGFRPYTPAALAELAEDIKENGLLEKGIARPIPDTDEYEVLSGNNRMDAFLLLGLEEMPFEVENADDNRAIIIATVTNLKRRQNLLPSERGWAYRAMLEAQRAQGKRTDLCMEGTCGEIHHKSEDATCGEIRHKLKTRDKVAKYFGVDVNILRREIQLTYLIQPLLDAVDERRLKDTCGEIISRYDEASQQLFYELWDSKGQKIAPKIVKYIKKCCPAPSFSVVALAAAWEDAEAAAQIKKKKAISFSFEPAQIEPLISKLGGEEHIQALFLEFLKERAG